METNNKLREALKDIGRLVEQIHFLYSDYPSEIHEIARKVNAALAEPVKNYEVGTVEDWLARFSVVCERCSGSDCDHRQFKDEEVCDCFARWLQTPYKEGGAK